MCLSDCNLFYPAPAGFVWWTTSQIVPSFNGPYSTTISFSYSPALPVATIINLRRRIYAVVQSYVGIYE